MRKLTCKIGLIAAILVFGATNVLADYPDRPIKFVAATTPGGTADILARGLGEAMSKILGQPIIVENKPGADQIIGLEYAAKGQPADGYTAILLGLDGQALLRFPSLALLNDLGVDAVHVPYPGAAPYMTAVASGAIDWVFLGEVNATTLKSRVRILAITGKERSATNPDIPTFNELGFPKLFGPAYALAVRKGTPQAVADKLTAAATLAMNSPEVKAYWNKASIELKSDTAEVARRTLMDRYKFYEEFVKNGTMKAE